MRCSSWICQKSRLDKGWRLNHASVNRAGPTESAPINLAFSAIYSILSGLLYVFSDLVALG